MKIRLKAALLVGGILPYAILQLWAIIQYRRLQPTNVPLRFQVGRFSSPDFVIPESGGYRLLIEIDNKFSRASCVFGFLFWDYAQHRFQTAEAIDLRWKVLSGRLVVAMGPIEPPNQLFVNRVARGVGHFEALKGHQYMVEVDLVRDPCGLDAANPRLIVESYLASSEVIPSFLQATFFLALLVTVSVVISTVPSALRAVKYRRVS